MSDADPRGQVRYLAVPDDPCAQAMSRLGWVAFRSFRIGNLHVGIRVNTPELDSALSSCLRDVSVDDPHVAPNYAIRREEPPDPRARARYRVYLGCKHVTTTRTLERAIAILCGLLEHHLPRRLPDGQLDLVAVTFVRANEAVLAPWQVRQGSPTIEARLERDGIRMLEHRSVAVDVASKEVVVGPTLLPSPPKQASIDSLVRERRVQPGRYRLRSWLLWKGWRWEHITPGIATAYGMSVARHDDDPAGTLRGVARLVEGLPLAEVRTEKDIVNEVRALWL